MKNNQRDSVSKFQPQKVTKVKASIVKISKLKSKIVVDEHAKLTLEELKKFIKDNLSIQIKEERDYYSPTRHVDIALLLGGEVISSDSFTIN